VVWEVAQHERKLEGMKGGADMKEWAAASIPEKPGLGKV